MIPKIIHYCWFSNEELPRQAKQCIDSWRLWLPDYEIKRWTLQDFDSHSVRFTHEALDSRKWAFLTDYVRHYALYLYGGLYMDSDVMLYGDVSKLLDSDFVSACEYHPTQKDKSIQQTQIDIDGFRISKGIKVDGIGVQAAFIASIPGHPVSKKILEYYKELNLETVLFNRYTAPTVMAYCMEDCGFRYIDKEQRLKNDIHLYPSRIISNYDQKSRASMAVHWCAGSWTNRSVVKKIIHLLNQVPTYRYARDIIKKNFIRK